MPLHIRPALPLIGAKRSRDVPGPSNSVNSSTAAPPSKKVRRSEIEIQTAKTSETLEKRDKDWKELCAKFEGYKE